MKKNDWKKREGVVFSTDSNFEFQQAASTTPDTLPPRQQNLKVFLDTNGRAGKKMTMVSGFVGSVVDLESLTKLLKTKCGVGGSSKDNEILIQGDVRQKVLEILEKEGYRARVRG